MAICCTIIAFKLYHKTCEQFYRHLGIYEKSPNSFLPGLSHSIVNQFDFHNFLCLCLASVHLPHPLHLIFGFQLFGHAVSLRQLRHDQLHAVSCRFVNLSAILSYVHPAMARGEYRQGWGATDHRRTDSSVKISVFRPGGYFQERTEAGWYGGQTGQVFAASAGMQKRRLITARGGRGPQAARRCAAGKRASPASALPGAAPGLRPAFPTPQAPERGSVTGPKGRPAPTAGRCASGRTDKTATGERCHARRYTAPAGWRQIPSSTGSR